MRTFNLSTVLVLAAIGLATSVAEASDYILTIGGGPTPESNQVSLESNVLYFQRTLAKLGMDGLDHQILFADGEDERRDLQYQAREKGGDELKSMLAEIVGPTNDYQFNYRTSSIPGISGAAKPDAIEDALTKLSNQLTSNDRLVFYFTGHGGRPRPGTQPRESRFRKSVETKDKAEEPQPKKDDKDKDKEKKNPLTDSDNLTHLWPHEQMSVKEWTDLLDRLPADTKVVAVMVQCYSGGFGNLIFKGGESKNGIAAQPRCGFFSTVPDRVAAGCTANIDQAEYREYSSYFLEAISGVSRTGKPVSRPDFDQDGITSMLEAHAYTSLTADTIDIPIRTSDTLLRHLAKTTGESGLLSANSPVEVLLAGADPCEKAVVEGLSQRFQLTGANRGKAADDLIRKKQAEKKKLDDQIRDHRKKVGEAKSSISKTLKEAWPELASPWHPELDQIFASQSEKVRETITAHESYAKWREAESKSDELEAEREQIGLDIVKLERLKYWLETRALAVNLPICTDQKNIDAYRRVVELESQPFARSTKPTEGQTAAK